MSKPPTTPGGRRPASPETPGHALRAMFAVRGSPPRRWAFALRASICMGVPVLAGWLAGDVAAGLMANIGGFTALFGSDRPYPRRAGELALIALAFAVAVALGIAAAGWPWAVVPMLAVFAMLATWLANGLQVGPPGAYMFLLACAAGTAMPAGHLGPLHAGALVLTGGAFAWLVHMAGALVSPRGPERAAVARAGEAVASLVDAVGTPQETSARHAASMAMRDAWSALYRFQPAHAHPGSRLGRLRTMNHDLHRLLVDTLAAAAGAASLSADAAARARAISAQAADPPRTAHAADGSDHPPMGRPHGPVALLEAIRPGSPSLLVVLRVGVAAAAAGAVGVSAGLAHAYWATAAAVLMLHQGFDWIRTLQRSAERLLGTWVGLLLAGAVLLWHPQGLWLVATVMVLQFTIEMVVVRNYALAVVFITAAALTIASGGQAVDGPGAYLLSRGVDTAVGCAIALVVYRLMPSRRAAALVGSELERTFAAIADMAAQLVDGRTTGVEARTAQRALQQRTFALLQAHDAAIVASRGQRRVAERLWPVVASAERLAYRVLAACWGLESADARGRALGMLDGAGAAQLRSALSALATGVRGGRMPTLDGPLPELLADDLRNVRDALPPREP